MPFTDRTEKELATLPDKVLELELKLHLLAEHFGLKIEGNLLSGGFKVRQSCKECGK